MRREQGLKRTKAALSATPPNGNLSAEVVDYQSVATTLAIAKALPDHVELVEEQLLALVCEIVAAQPLFAVAPGLVETNPAELLRRVLAKAQQQLSSPKQ